MTWIGDALDLPDDVALIVVASSAGPPLLRYWLQTGQVTRAELARAHALARTAMLQNDGWARAVVVLAAVLRPWNTCAGST